MRLLFAGTPATAVPALEALLGSSHEVVAVLTRPDAPAGRGRRLEASPVHRRAQEAGIEVLTPARPAEPEFERRLRELAVDCAPVVAYGALLRQPVLGIPRHGWVNLHFSVLPAWRGAAPVQHAIMAGDEITGASTFRIEEGLDTGPVFGTLTEAVRPTDTAGDLLDRLAHAGARLLVATLDAIADGSAAAVPQPADGVSHAPRLSVADARVAWGAPAHVVDRRIRGCTPAPGAWTTLGDLRIKVGPVRPVPGDRRLAPGELEVGRGGVLVGTATDAVALGEVAPAGRSWMAADAWARGARPAPGAVLGEAAP